ncbi:MAG TPA: DUF3617 domain-containing protein [Bryobacteraceae bacterium]|nr:DUF3617 domain-containing protein [Bryobacteraceae bacterium]
MIKNAVSLAILSACACRAADNLTPLNAKPGLWEVTSTTERNGMPPIPAEALAKMSPEQRARIEAQFKGTAQTTTKQSCFTQEDVAKGFGFNNSLEKSCRQTIVGSSESKLEIKWECEGAQKNSGSMKIEAPDSSHVNSLINITMGANGNVMNMKVTNSAKWLSNSCGDVKPDSGKKE